MTTSTAATSTASFGNTDVNICFFLPLGEEARGEGVVLQTLRPQESRHQGCSGTVLLKINSATRDVLAQFFSRQTPPPGMSPAKFFQDNKSGFGYVSFFLNGKLRTYFSTYCCFYRERENFPNCFIFVFFYKSLQILS